MRSNAIFTCLSICALAAPALAWDSRRMEEPKTKVELIRPWELRKLSSTQRFEYYRALQSLIATLENATDGKESERNAIRFLIPAAVAMPKSGDECVIGGYVSSWARRGDGRLSCQAPNEAQMFDVDTSPKEFFCGPSASGDARMAHCNSAVFLYASDEGERFCKPLKNFSQSCRGAFEERYGQASGGRGDPNFPARLNRDFERLARSMDAGETDSRLAEFSRKLSALIDGNDFDPRTTEAMRRQLTILKETKERVAIASAPAETFPAAVKTDGPVSHDSGPNAAGAPPATARAPVVPVANASASRPTSGTGAGETEGEEPEKPVQPAVISVEQSREAEKILGKELKCVHDGLARVGYAPSPKYLALLATGIQADNGAFNPNQETSRAQLQKRVISMVQSYGFCDEASYSSRGLKAHHLTKLRRWMSADNGKARPAQGMSYLKQMMDPQSESLVSRDLNDIFGIRAEIRASKKDESKTESERFDRSVETPFRALFMGHDDWQKRSLADRQARIHDWREAKASSAFAKCHANAQERRKRDRAFQLQELRLSEAKSAERALLSQKRRQKMERIYKANMNVCMTMAASCGVDAAKACAGEVPSVAMTGAPTVAQPAPENHAPILKVD